MNQVLEHVKITDFEYCRNVIQAAIRIVGEVDGMKKSNAKKKRNHSGKEGSGEISVD